MTARPHLCLVHQKVMFPFIFEKAAELNIDLTLAHRPGENPPGDLPAVIERFPLDLGNHEEAVDELRRRHRKKGFDGLTTLWEGAVPFVARAAQEMGLPGIEPEGAALTRDKGKVRHKLREAGANCPEFEAVSGVEDLERIGRIRYPVVVKPAHGYGSLGVIRADNDEELRAAVASVAELNSKRLKEYCGGANDIVIESYLVGPEYLADTFMLNGRLYVAGIAYKGCPEGPYFEETVYITPAPISASLYGAITDEVTRTALALGIRNGPVHTEFRLDSDGKPVAVDIAARVGASGMSALIVGNSRDFDLREILFLFSMGQLDESRLKNMPPQRTVGSSALIPVYEGGVLVGLDKLEEVRRHPATRRFHQLTPFGGRIASYPDFSGYPGVIFGRHDSFEDAEAYLRWVLEVLRPRYQP